MVSTELREELEVFEADAVVVRINDWPDYKRMHQLRVVRAHPGAIWTPGQHVNAQCACGQWHRAPKTTITCTCGLPVEPVWHEGEWRVFSPPVLFVADALGEME